MAKCGICGRAIPKGGNAKYNWFTPEGNPAHKKCISEHYYESVAVTTQSRKVS